MKASELLAICFNFESNYIYSDMNTGASFGCECECGGDSYTGEEWEQMCNETEEAKEQFKALCERLGVEWDYD